MGDENDTVIVLEQAKSGRSTCRSTGTPIAAQEWRVGFECFLGGRMSMAWMKPLPFLQDCCSVQYCLNAGNQGSCKATQHKFSRGEVRFVCTAGDPKRKMYLTLDAAGAELRPVLQQVGRDAFSPTSFQGLAALAEEDRKRFYKAFAVEASEAASFDEQHPPPEPPSLESPAKAAKAAAKAAKATAKAASPAKPAKAAKQAAKQPAEAEGERRSKRARTSAAGSAAAAEAEASSESGSEEEPQEEEEEEPQGPQQRLTEYELQRQEQIRRNRERMMALDLPALASELAPAPPRATAAAAKHKGVTASRKRPTEAAPRRESSRIRGIAADGSQVHSERQGEVVIVAGEVIRRYAPGTMTEEQAPQERHPLGELPFQSSNRGPHTDEAFIQLLAHAAAAASSSGSGSGGDSSGNGGSKKARRGGSGGAKQVKGALLGAAGMARLQLAEDDVAKVTKDATTHLAFHPTSDTLVVACADKKGNVGLWHINEGSFRPPAWQGQPILRPRTQQQQHEGAGQQAEHEGQEGGPGAQPAGAAGTAALSLDAAGESEQDGGEEGFDGVLLLQAQHYQYISGLKWAGGSGRGASLFTASYDGSLRCMDVQAGVSALVHSSDDDEYSCMDVTGDGRTALLGDNEGALHVVDVRAGQPQGKALTLHRKKINTISFEPVQEQVFATASTDTSIQLWDVRKLGAGLRPLACANHTHGCQAALFAPDGSKRLVSTSFDSTLRIWDGAQDMAPLLTIKHDNNTGRWVLPFRACWNAASDGVIVGNMKRFVDVFDAGSGAMTAQLHSDHMTAIASRNAVHPQLPVLASATNSGRIHIYR
ncbi:hypothetical protein D9Q98_002758 [Chlorella vulgaris]|uniref:Uncharacterized protein n=1 Tax=Chlorella vulgaris TaxID=3077 RepID=A0A9D4Z017_CHLVU|nr:hypothetical protein D9Q98_002758 [Chlorella vulgaris]